MKTAIVGALLIAKFASSQTPRLILRFVAFRYTQNYYLGFPNPPSGTVSLPRARAIDVKL